VSDVVQPLVPILMGAAPPQGQVSSDNFDRANNADIGANWDSNTGTMKIVSNRVEASNLSSDAVETWNADSFGDDQFSQATLSVVSDSGAESGFGVGVRWASGTTKTGYWAVARVSSNAVDLYVAKFVAGAYTLLGSGNADFANGDVMRFEVEGQNPNITLRVKKNGTTVLTVSNETSIGSGRPALAYSSGGTINTPAIDDWSGGDN